MRKLRKAAVVVTVLGSVGLLGAGTAYAGGGTSDYRTQSVHEGYQQQSSGGLAPAVGTPCGSLR